MTDQQHDQVDEDAGEAARPTAEEITDSLTGWDEIAISEACGQSLSTVGQFDPIMTIRLLIAVAESRRLDVRYAQTYRAAMDLTQREALDYFPDAPEPMPSEPVTAAGKGD